VAPIQIRFERLTFFKPPALPKVMTSFQPNIKIFVKSQKDEATEFSKSPNTRTYWPVLIRKLVVGHFGWQLI
jgi:hypothetical protein